MQALIILQGIVREKNVQGEEPYCLLVWNKHAGGEFSKINKHAGSNKAVQGGFFSNIDKRAVHVY